MDIYKLKDFENIDGGEASVDAGELRITDLRQAVKNENRVNVFVNKKYSFSLDISQVVDFRLKKGMVITEGQLKDYKKASEFGKLYQRALEWTLTRPHSEREVRDYLYRKLRASFSGALRGASPSLAPSKDRSELPSPEATSPKGSSELPSPEVTSPKGNPEISKEEREELIDKIISRLTSKGYIDDARFAQYYAENRFVKKGISKKRLRMELAKKGIAKDILDEVLDVRNDEEEILKVIAKKRAKYTDDKLIQYLCRQGFSYQLAQDLVRSYETDSQNLE